MNATRTATERSDASRPAAGAAVVTGIGAVAPGGIGTEEVWAAALEGRMSIGPLERLPENDYPLRVAGEVREFQAKGRVPSRLSVETDRWTHLSLVAAEMALADAQADLDALPADEMAVVTASSSGGTEFGQREIERLWSAGPSHVGAYQSIAWFYAASTGQISIRHGMKGPCGVICTEEAGGLDALAQARRNLRDGARLVVTGGTDASLCPYGVVAQLSNGLLSTEADPERAYQPFSVNAGGYVPGEGGAMVVVEDEHGADERGAPRRYGEIAGYGATFDPPPGSSRPPTLRTAIEKALADAAITAGDVDVVFADALAIPEADRLEAEAIGAVFGERGVPVTAPKAGTGRLYAGGGALDVMLALLSIRDGVIPTTPGSAELAADCPIDLVRGGPRERPVRTALVLARGHGGFNSALVVRARR